MSTLKILMIIITGIGLVGCIFFVIAYWLTTSGAWRKEEAGWFMMVRHITLAVLFMIVIINQVHGPWPGREFFTLIVFSAFVAELWWPMRLLSRAQRERQGKEAYDANRPKKMKEINNEFSDV